MPEAMVKIRQELGNDAVILNSKRVETGGFLGFFTKKNIEVIAAVDPEISKKRIKKPNVNSFERRRKESLETSQLSKEIEEIKKMIVEMNEKTSPLQIEEYPGELQNINDLFVYQEIKDVYRLQIMKALLKKWYAENGENQNKVVIWKWAEDELSSLLYDLPFKPFDYKKRYLNVVGPTGVGKTTTLAKIAAKAVINDEKKVAFITTDTYRIAAIDQLKTYAKILNVPVEVAYSIDDFKKAKEKLRDYDFILVDSAGRNFRNPLYVEQLKDVIDFDEEMETHLVLALTSKYVDMQKIVEQFHSIPIDRFIFTKADETETFGAMLNICIDYNIGASYLTMGQNVPDDIVNMTKEKVIERLLRR